MVTNEQIMDMLQLILKKVERLESIRADDVTIESGQITIHTGGGSIHVEDTGNVSVTFEAGSETGPLGFQFEDVEAVTINTGGLQEINLHNNGDIDGDIKISSGSLHTSSIETNGSLDGNVKISSGSIDNCSVECHGDIHGDVITHEEDVMD